MSISRHGYENMHTSASAAIPAAKQTTKSSQDFHELVKRGNSSGSANTLNKSHLIQSFQEKLQEFGNEIDNMEQPVFRRTKITHSGQVPTDDSELSFDYLIAALRLREKYMENSVQNFSRVPQEFLKIMDGEQELDEVIAKLKNNESVKQERTGYDDETPPPHIENPWNTDNLLPNNGYTVKTIDGIVRIYDKNNEAKPDSFPSLKEHIKDLSSLNTVVENGPLRTFCQARLNVLTAKYDIHINLNEVNELADQDLVPYRDFSNVLKIDTHIHSAACMRAEQLLAYVKKTAETDADQPVLPGKNKGDPPITLGQIFKSMNISPKNLSAFSLDCRTDREAMYRFDKFNECYNVAGNPDLRKVYLKQSNLANGKYFAELIKEAIESYEQNKYIYAELRISISGKKKSELEELAKWTIDHNIYSDNIRWVITIPKQYPHLRESNAVKSFAEMMSNIFEPFIQATIDSQGHPLVAKYLEYVIGFDCVDDEGQQEVSLPEEDTPSADEWTSTDNPCYAYYLYYFHANIAVLNNIRRERGLNIFPLRPHCGENGSTVHLVSGYLLCENITHGIRLTANPALEYLYYLAQIPITMAPISNSALFIKYIDHPVAKFLARGHPITLSSDDPLVFHYTKEPLLEEYAVAVQVFKLSTCDLCEMARNSVLLSGYAENVKEYWLGKNYRELGVAGNDVGKTNVPDVRVAYRFETLIDELYNLCKGTSLQTKKK